MNVGRTITDRHIFLPLLPATNMPSTLLPLFPPAPCFSVSTGLLVHEHAVVACALYSIMVPSMLLCCVVLWVNSSCSNVTSG